MTCRKNSRNNLLIVFFPKLMWCHKISVIKHCDSWFKIAEKNFNAILCIQKKLQIMLHNLKSLSMRRIGVFSANADQPTNVLQKLLYFRTIASHAMGFIRCWRCGNEISTAGIQFKCIKCQSLLELPNDVVFTKNKHFLIWNGFQEQIGIDFAFAFRIIFNSWELISDSISTSKHWTNNFGRFRMYCIRTNSAIGIIWNQSNMTYH